MKQERKAVLQKRLDQGYTDYMEQLQGKTASELIELASEIAAVQMIREELVLACSEEDIKFLLRLKNPLTVLREYWNTGVDYYDHTEELGHMLWEIQDREMYSKDDLLPCPVFKAKKQHGLSVIQNPARNELKRSCQPPQKRKNPKLKGRDR